MLKLARVQARGQVTLPREVRKRLGIRPKDVLVFAFDSDGQIRLSVLPFVSADELFAQYPGDAQAVDMATVRQAAEHDAAEEYVRAHGGASHAAR